MRRPYCKSSESGSGLVELLVGAALVAVLLAMITPFLQQMYADGALLSAGARDSMQQAELRVVVPNLVSQAGWHVGETPELIQPGGGNPAVGVQFVWSPADGAVCNGVLEDAQMQVAGVTVSGLTWTASEQSGSGYCQPGSAFLPIGYPDGKPWSFTLTSAPGCFGGHALDIYDPDDSNRGALICLPSA